MRKVGHDTSSLGGSQPSRGRYGPSGSAAARSRLFVGLMLVLTSTMMAGCSNLQRDRWLGADKLKHLAVGTAIAAGTTYAAHEAGASIGDARAAGVSVVLTLGAGKELYDQKVKRTYWSWQDMTWNLLGGLLGSLLVRRSD